MRRLVTFTATALIALMVLSSSANAYSQNDAGTGGDASDARATPTRLAGAGTYYGQLPANDADWYAPADSASLGCNVLKATTTRAATLTIATADHAITSTTTAWESKTLAIAGGNAGFAAGILPNDANWVGYTFSLKLKTLAQMGPPDAGTGADAGSTLASAIGIGDAPCIAGTLDPTALDTVDTYTFGGTQGTHLTVSFAGAGGSMLLRVFDPNGMPVGSPVSTDQLATLTLPSTGTYSMTASSGAFNLPGTLQYVIGVIGPPGCEPACISI